MNKTLRLITAAAALGIAIAASAKADGDAEMGKKLFARCNACHATGEEKRVGPGLANIVGRPAASATGYTYSAAMKNSGLTWDEATLDQFLKFPQAIVKGTRMNLALPKDSDRADVIAYLKTLATE